MPLTDKGEKIMSRMKDEYGSEQGERVFYASKNKGRITGVDDEPSDAKLSRMTAMQLAEYAASIGCYERDCWREKGGPLPKEVLLSNIKDRRSKGRNDAEYLAKEKAWLNVTRGVYDGITVGKKYTLPDGKRFELLEKKEGGRHSAGMPQIYVLWLGAKERRPVPGQSRGDASEEMWFDDPHGKYKAGKSYQLPEDPTQIGTVMDVKPGKALFRWHSKVSFHGRRDADREMAFTAERNGKWWWHTRANPQSEGPFDSDAEARKNAKSKGHRTDSEIIEDCEEIKTDAELDCDTRDDDHSKDGIAQLIAAHYAPVLERAGYKALAHKARYGKLADVVAVGREVSALQYNKAAPYNDNLHAAINAMTGLRGASLAELRGVAQGHGIRVDAAIGPIAKLDKEREMKNRNDAVEHFDSMSDRLSAIDRLSAAINVVGKKVNALARVDAVAADSGVGLGMQMSPAEMDKTLQSYFDRRKFSYTASDATDNPWNKTNDSRLREAWDKGYRAGEDAPRDGSGQGEVNPYPSGDRADAWRKGFQAARKDQ